MRVIVIDDTILFRKLISDVITEDPNIEIVGRCRNGIIGLNKIRELKPDIVTLDLEMPEMDGLEVLDNIKKENIDVGVIVVSCQTSIGGSKTIQALQKGAFDFITKPNSDSIEENKILLKKSLLPKFKALMLGRSKSAFIPKNKIVENISITSRHIDTPQVVALGISTGGPEALRRILPNIPASFKLPILIVQHMPAIFTKSLSEMLNNLCPLNVKEAENRDLVKRGNIYLAPGGKQMKVVNENNQMQIRINDDPPENSCKPAVDYLFRSLANNFPGKTLSVVMTGMGSDGLLGVKLLKRHGCVSIVQDEPTSVVYGMPKMIIEAQLADIVVPLDQIPNSMMEAVIKC